jgi:hypothetical protein
MRLPFELNGHKFQDEARVKFSFSSPEFHQNIEISIDGDETSVEVLLDAFERFMSALGISIPENVVLGFVELPPDDKDSDDEDDEQD